jgi:hypothetical protein
LQVWCTRRIAQSLARARPPEPVEDDGHVGGGVFVSAMQTDQGIEDQQAWRDLRHGRGEPVEAVGQADAGFDDDLDGQRGQRLGARRRQRGEALDDDGRRILGGAEQDGARRGDGEAPGGGGR